MNTAKVLSDPPWEEVTRRLIAEMEPDRIILFGSYAWGSPDEGSDLDLLVIVPHSDQPPTLRAVSAYRCLGDIPFPVMNALPHYCRRHLQSH